MKKLGYYLVYLMMLLMPFSVMAYSNKIIPGGENIGIEINSNGILVVGFYKVNGKYNKGVPDINMGDYITKVNNITVNTINDLVTAIDKEIKNDKVQLTILRDSQEIKVDFKLKEVDGTYKTGLYVKDKLSGIGTVTYIDPETKIYGALGHEILESNTNRRIEVKDGLIYESYVTGINKSQDGVPGSKNAKINYDYELGTIDKNTEVGIYGTYIDDIENREALEIMDIDDVNLGKAYIYTVVNVSEVKQYEIEITKINKNSKIKNFTFEIVDEKLIQKTGGIVQGMSGSPIIQDNKILGAVTHVIVDDVKTGYGVAIKTMLEEGERNE